MTAHDPSASTVASTLPGSAASELPRRPSGTPHRRRGLAVLSGVVVLAVAGCSAVTPAGQSGATTGGAASVNEDVYGEPAAADKVKQGGKLTVALSAEPDRLDPSLSRSLYSRYVFQAMCEKLYDVDEKAQVVPQLATALPTVSADGKTVTIPVRQGVKFADGTTSTRRR